MIWNLIKMLSGVVTPIAVMVVIGAAGGGAALAFRCPALLPVLAVVMFLLFCWMDNWNKRRKGD